MSKLYTPADTSAYQITANWAYQFFTDTAPHQPQQYMCYVIK